METKYKTTNDKELKDELRIVSGVILFMLLSLSGICYLSEQYNYVEKLDLLHTFPGFMLSMGQILTIFGSLFLAWLLIFMTLSMMSLISPNLKTKEEVVERIKSNEKKVTKLLNKNKELKNLINIK